MFKIMGRHNRNIEELDTAETEKEARYLVGEYTLAFSKDWKIWFQPGDKDAGK